MPLSKFFPCFQFRLEDNVNKLDYSNNIFSEGFPQVWQYERTLEELNVNSTRINNLPPQLFYCQGLRNLLASNNNLDDIPDAIGSLKQLLRLNLSRNFISNVPDTIKSCKNLTHLDLSCNALQKLPDALTYLISLQELILNETYLEYLPANFGRLVNLRILELRSNNLISLPKSMQRLSNLQRLDIGCNEFNKMPEVIGELKQLRELWFDYNQIENLPLQLGKLRELIHCEANGNRLTCFPNEIGNWRNLEVLSVSINNLTHLSFSLGMLKSLVVLKCEMNELKDLPDSISNLENLEELVISHNKLNRLPNTIGMLRKLRHLFADDNNLQTLPEEICSCSLLSVLSLSQNKISHLPVNIGHLTNLKVLNIVQNNIATLPVTILSLRNLTSLWISDNQSKPLIPLQYADISDKTQLTCFMLPQQKESRTNKCFFNHLKQTPENESILDEAAACTISKRRICFAEETTVLHTNNERHQQQLSVLKSELNNSNKDINIVSATKSPLSTHFYDNNDQIRENVHLKSVDSAKDFLMRSPTPYPKELRLMAKFVQSNHRKSLNHGKVENEVYFYEENMCADSSTLNYKNENSNISIEEDYTNVKQKQINIQNNTDVKVNTDSVNNIQEFFIADCSPKPPPYHIARCFTKKSVEDLTRYEFLRQRQVQHYQHLKANFEDNETFLPNDIVNNPEINCNYENNFLNQETDEVGDSAIYKTQKDITDRSKVLIKANQKINKDYLDTAHSSKITSNRTQTKWLFGVHRNPRVIQVNINSENGRDFEIDILPNREGIFIVSTISNSYASKLLQLSDKLLEVDGIDFTNISINEARQVLDNCGPSMSIMLSRK